jgi:hypothetical protein
MTHEERVAQQQALLAKAMDLKGLADALISLQAMVFYLLTAYNLWSPEGTFTFPDGDTVERAQWEATHEG